MGSDGSGGFVAGAGRGLTAVQERIDEIRDRGYCVLRSHFAPALIDTCRKAFWPVLLAYLEAHHDAPNRGVKRHFLPMPFTRPCFAPEFFFDEDVLSVVRGVMDQRVVCDQWGCDVPLRGSGYQDVHVDYRRPLFEEAPNLVLPNYAMVVSFGLVRIAPENGPIEIGPGTPVPLEIGDVMIRNPWALHRGSPNRTDTPRAMASLRYVRRWYWDDSREVEAIPHEVWDSLTPAQQQMMRFRVQD